MFVSHLTIECPTGENLCIFSESEFVSICYGVCSHLLRKTKTEHSYLHAEAIARDYFAEVGWLIVPDDKIRELMCLLDFHSKEELGEGEVLLSPHTDESVRKWLESI